MRSASTNAPILTSSVRTAGRCLVCRISAWQSARREACRARWHGTRSRSSSRDVATIVLERVFQPHAIATRDTASPASAWVIPPSHLGKSSKTGTTSGAPTSVSPWGLEPSSGSGGQGPTSQNLAKVLKNPGAQQVNRSRNYGPPAEPWTQAAVGGSNRPRPERIRLPGGVTSPFGAPLQGLEHPLGHHLVSSRSRCRQRGARNA